VVYIDIQEEKKVINQCLITTNVVSSDAVHGEVCSIQHYVIKFLSVPRQVGGFLPDTPVS